MFNYSLTLKNVPDAPTYIGQLKAVNSAVVGFTVTDSAIVISSTQEIYSEGLAALDAITPAARPAIEIVKSEVHEAIDFGFRLIVEFAAENVLLGITQANMTNTVRTNMKEIVNALYTGALYSAIDEARAMPPESKDAVFITDARLLAYINKIEAYLGEPLSESL